MTLFEVLHAVSIACLGVFTGAMLTEGFVLVPYWRSLSSRDFFAWYAANDRRLFRFFGAVTVAAALTTVSAAGVAWWSGAAGGTGLVVAAIAVLAAVAMFPLCFEKANARFAAASVPSSELPGELERWQRLHWVRTALVSAAFLAALLARVRICG